MLNVVTSDVAQGGSRLQYDHMPNRLGKSSLVAVLIVFGLAVLMVFKNYDPAVITAVVTGTSLAAAELVRRLMGGAHREDS